MDLTNEQIIRYSRHLLLENVGEKGQQKLLGSKVLIIGLGGLGSPASLYLGAAGVGTLGLVDMDRVDLSNLQRQIVHSGDSINELKVISAKNRINAINPDVNVIPINIEVNCKNIIDIVSGYDFILECTDNFSTKYLINDAAILADKPFNQGGILCFKGQTMTHVPGSASYRCVYQSPPSVDSMPNGFETGVLGAIAGILGAIQASEALKYLLGIGELLIDRLLTFDALTMDFRTITIKKTEWGNVASENTKVKDLAGYL